MKINNHYTSPITTPVGQNKSANPSFGAGTNSTARKVFEFLGDQCSIQSTGSLKRIVFLVTSGVFMLGSRFTESRDKDEKREVLTRDIPGITLAAYGAPAINNAVARTITNKSGIPIIFSDDGKFKFATQKQVTDWYSGWKDVPDPLVTFSEKINGNKGNIQKVMKKLGFESQLKAVTSAADNKSIIDALKQSRSTDEFKTLENSIKGISENNALVRFAKNAQAGLKIGAILMTAALLGYLIPRLNILVTRSKYIDAKGNKLTKEAAEAQKTEQNEAQKTPSVDQIQTGSFPNTALHNKSTPQAFKSFNHFFA